VHAAAAEAGGLAGRVQPGMISPSAPSTRRVEVGLQAAERLAGQDVELDGDQRAGLRVEDAVRGGGADQRSPM
jgi:hypothetical protein